MCRVIAFMSVVALFMLSAPAGAAPIVNGDFGGGLSDWTPTGPVSDGGGFAVLDEDTVFALTSLEQSFVIPASTQSLSFDYVLNATLDGTSGFPVADAFAASLLDPFTFAPILNTPGFTDFFYHDADGFIEFDPSIVSLSSGTVTLDLTSIAAGTDALIVFDLYGGDDGWSTTLHIDNVQLQTSAVPEPASAVLWAGMIGSCVCGWTTRRRRQRAA